MAHLVKRYLYPFHEPSVVAIVQRDWHCSCSLVEHVSIPMTPSPCRSQSLSIAGAVSFAGKVLRRALAFPISAEETLGCFLAAVSHLMSVAAAFEAGFSPVWALTGILSMPVAQTPKAASRICAEAYSMWSPANL